MSNVPSHLPGDLGEHDPRREAHPQGNIPHSGGHEVKIGSSEQQGINDEATAAKHSHNSDPRTDNTAEHALEGGSVESMDRQKRQHNSSIPGGRTGHDGVDDHLTRGGLEQGSHGSNAGLTGNHGSGLTGNHSSTSGLTGSGLTGSGLTGSSTHHHGSTGSGLTGSSTHHHGSTGSGLTGGLSQSGTEPISGVRGAGVGGAPYDAGNLQSSGFSGSDPQERHQLHHGTAHHAHDFSHEHTTRTGALLDPANGRDTGIPGYAGGATTGTGLTGSSHTGTGLTGSSHTGTGLTGSHTGTGLTGSSHTGTGLTGSHTGTGLTGSEGLLREGERAVHTGTHGSTGSGLTGTHGATSGLGSSTTGAGYGQTGTTGERLRDDVRQGEHVVGSTGHHGSTGSGLTGSTTGRETTGERLRDDVREGEHATGHNTTDTTKTKTKPSLLDKLNPLKDADGDGKKGFMK
ncbi:hypothetical protein AUEXF2481DRAFT_4963 [Aureobasidium subglaciale EXF-2481]|uniref:Uncharacterized protein n=1 Tax=Aureobasidium subglaciale (strain EXF-2481) TaxID=1043005 RepID=A0A074YGZ7_AURSE|nr:uncharacterized protein AUEXF2481DRAFT_4963 [Aureobasidium subglaciale EXF-2481]KAI5204977.1 hypothetical protein E4T38_04536 [Aureobasidium subglaciale]KAI5223892.1 hypothetical protein E4T40_04312 [Aureobasidium subglaciale]KAI5227438.1 hypothetical protein E4T41_04394 [Aureobasidium subglaciale]KAI5262783.1 hypothetical protein E4T46_04280 [Aureobasidium subglaciale]KEQ95349.1 hypothetical protein AUEXF2481DRAFT_4963 [Aureobasidium subglaciale EXF-2481]